MIRRLENVNPDGHNWRFNDRVNQHYFNWVKEEGPCVINLYWKEDDDADEQFIGSYALNMSALLDSGYVRTDVDHPGQALVRFQRVSDDRIQIAINGHSKALDCGIVLRG